MLILILILIFSLNSLGNVSSELSNYIDLALQHNPSYLIQKTEVQKSENTLKSTYSNFLPDLSLQASQRHNRVNSIETDAGQVSLNANLNLFNGFGDKAKYQSAKLSLDSQSEQLRRIQSDIVFEIKKAYYNYTYAKELDALLRKITQRRKQQLDLINLRFEGGREDKGSYLQAKARYEQSKFEQVQTTRLLETSFQNLASAIGIPKESLGKPQKNLELMVQKIDRGQLDVEKKLEETPEYKIAVLDRDIAKKEVSIANSSFSPQLDLQGSLGKSGEQLSHLDTNTASAAIVLSFPIFQGNSRKYQFRNARLSQANKENNIWKIKNSLRANLTESQFNFMSDYDNLKIQQNFLSSSKIKAEVADNQYKSGVINYTNWDIVQTDLIQSEKSILSSRKTVLTSKAQFENLIGQGY